MRSNENVAARTLTFILAGGEGRRLSPLTRYRPKPLVPFGGCYRIVDFTLSNCLNSGLKRVYVLTQHESESVGAYLRKGWSGGPATANSFSRARRPAESITRELPMLFCRTCFSWSSTNVSSRSSVRGSRLWDGLSRPSQLPCGESSRSDDCHSRSSTAVLNRSRGSGCG